MADAPKFIPPEVIEALKRGDKATAIKTMMQTGQIKSLRDVMRILEQLQASGAVKGVNVSVTSRTKTAAHEADRGMLPTAAGGPAREAPPHSKPHVSAAPPAPLRAGLSPGEMPRSSGTGIGYIVLAVAAVIVAWYVLR